MGRKYVNKTTFNVNRRKDNREVMAAVNAMMRNEGLIDADLCRLLNIKGNALAKYKTLRTPLPTSALFFLARKLGYNIYLVKYPRLKR